MPRSMAFEMDDERSRVLGFSLAEVLLLLLFLLLMVMGARYLETKLLPDISQEEEWTELLRREARLAPIQPLMDEARDLNPASPEEPLRIGLQLIRQLGEDVAPDQLSGVLVQVAGLMKAATASDPADPAAPLKRALDGLQGVAAENGPMTPALAALMQDASRLDPKNPVAVLRRAFDSVQPPTGSVPRDTEAGKAGWPPVISLSEADGYLFQAGSAELSPAFRETLSAVVAKRLREISETYGANIVEVVGHTDEQPLAGRPSNLDKLLLPYLAGQTEERLSPSDNAGLGLARAAAVVRTLREDGRLSGLRLLPLTGAQLIDPTDTLSGGRNQADKQRRRIEIRLRRSDRKPVQEQPEPRLAQKAAVEVAPPLPEPAVPQPIEAAAVQPRPRIQRVAACSDADWANGRCR